MTYISQSPTSFSIWGMRCKSKHTDVCRNKRVNEFVAFSWSLFKLVPVGLAPSVSLFYCFFVDGTSQWSRARINADSARVGSRYNLLPSCFLLLYIWNPSIISSSYQRKEGSSASCSQAAETLYWNVNWYDWSASQIAHKAAFNKPKIRMSHSLAPLR